MNQKEQEKILEKIGLTEGESNVYLVLSRLGSSTTGNIIRYSDIHGSKVYPILDRLIDKGLVSYIQKGRKRIYSANPPRTIKEYLEKKERNIQQLKEEADSLIEEISKKTLQIPTQATIFQGIKGLRTASEKMYSKLKKGDTLYYLGIPAKQPHEQHIYWQKDHKRREEQGINVKLLFNKDTDVEILKNRNSFKGSEARYMPTEIKTPALFAIYSNVVLIMLQNPDFLTIEIVNKHIAKSFLSYFWEFWNRSKSLDS